MKILIDECLPRKLKYELSDHEAVTVPEAGWAGMKNGELLKRMSGIYDVFITIDSSMQYQQALEDVQVSFILLSANNNKLETLLPLMDDVRSALERLQPGQVVRITAKSDQQQ